MSVSAGSLRASRAQSPRRPVAAASSGNPARIYLSSPHMSGWEERYVAEAFATNWIAPLGPEVDAFERELAHTVGVRGAVALSSGTAAIHLGLRLLGVGAGDSVFCSSLTFVASASPILYQNAEPVLIDSELGSWNMSPVALDRAFREADREGRLPKAVVVVNLYGQSADLDPIREICRRYECPILEDAAESLGATYRGRPSGSLGDLSIFSFNGNKIITTSGGGALVSDNLEALATARYWATQARDPAPHYEHSQVGYNYRLSNLLAAIGRGQLRVLASRVDSRRAVFDHYVQAFADLPEVDFMPEAQFGRSTRWLSVMTVSPRRSKATPMDIVRALERDNIEARPAWKPLHRQTLFESRRFYAHAEGESVADRVFATGVCLPSGSNLSPDDLDRVSRRVREALGASSHRPRTTPAPWYRTPVDATTMAQASPA